MTTNTPGATQDDSRLDAPAPPPPGPAGRALPGVAALRGILGALGLLGVALLIISTFATVVRIQVLTTSELVGQDTSITGGDLHGIALILVALFGLLMLAGALARNARPAMIGLAVTGLLALGLIVGLDVPELDNTGQIARFYEDVSAGAAAAFYYETGGAILLLLSGGGLYVLSADVVSGGIGAALGKGAGKAPAGTRSAAERRADERADRRACADAPAE